MHRRLIVACGCLALLSLSASAQSGQLVVGPDSGGGSVVRLFDLPSAAAAGSFNAYGVGFSGGVRVATGDVTGDGVLDIITAAGAGAAPQVKVFDGATHAETSSFLAFDAGFTGGVYVASGDINRDGRADIIASAGSATPRVLVFSGRDGSVLRDFFAYTPGFSGGVRVGAGDVNGDGFADIITSPGAGGGPQVRVFSGQTNNELHSFFAYDAGFTGGVFVAAADVNNDGRADIVTGTDASSPGHVKAFSGSDLSLLRSFLAFDASFTGGVRVGAGDVDGDGFAEIAAVTGPGVAINARVFDGQTGVQSADFNPYGSAFSGGAFIALTPEPGAVGMLAAATATLTLRGRRSLRRRRCCS
jgi:hypothetical protein